MMELNVQLLEKFKQCDRFIKDAYNSPTGVTEYINIMDAEFSEGQRVVNSWNADYKELKHIRWIRNQLAHDVSLEEDICTGSDYIWLCHFYNRLLKMDDPLAELCRCRDQRNQSGVYDSVRNNSYQEFSGGNYSYDNDEYDRYDTFKEKEKYIEILIIVVIIGIALGVFLSGGF